MKYIELRKVIMDLTELRSPDANRLLRQILSGEDRVALGELLEQNKTDDALALIKSKIIDHDRLLHLNLKSTLRNLNLLPRA